MESHLAKQLARQLSDDGFGAWPRAEAAGGVYCGYLPQEPGECVCVYAVDASVSGSAAGARLQVVARGKPGQLDSAAVTAQAVAEQYEGWRGWLGGDGCYASITVESGPSDLGPDLNGRPRYSVNLRVRYCAP